MFGNIFMTGLLFGLAIAAPVGPIGVLCIRRTLAYGRTYGFVSGLGAATADAIYGSIAGFGLAFVSAFMLNLGMWPQIVGGDFLCYLGVTTMLARPVEQAAHSGGRFIAAHASTLALTITNPLTLLSFAAIFASVGAVGDRISPATALVLVAGVFLGSALWWFLLTGGVSLLRHRVTANRLVWINRISGAIIMSFGIITFVRAV